MDNFMDKLAQRFNAQEIIRANSQAEAKELERLKGQLEAYEECLQEMRKLNLKNVESAETVKRLTESLAEKLENEPEQEEKERETLLAIREELQAGIKGLKGNFEKTEEFVHRENVKVYRNVQAVVVEELKRRSEELDESIKAGAKNKAVTVFLILNLLLGLANLGLLLAHMFFL